ncbi:hypothetical protein K4K60_000314, partial [Colletotrichum sp. SAR11_57]
MLLWNAAHPNASAIRSTPSIVLLYTTALPRGCCRNQSLTSWQPRSSTALNSPSSPSRPDPNPNPDFARRLRLAAPRPRPRPPDPDATTTTPYPIFLRVVASRNTRTRSGRIPVTAKNSRSSAGGNVAVKHTNCAPNSCTVRPNARNAGRNPLDPSNTTWHSSNTTRSNCCRRCNRPTKSRNPCVTADSGVTNTTVAAVVLARPPPRHVVDANPDLEHRASMSVRNATNGVTTIVTPSGAQYAGNMNDKLLPPPVPVTCTIGSSPRMIDRITRSCWPRNAARGSPIICRNCAAALANCNRVNRRRRCPSNSSSAAVVAVRRRLVGAPPPRSSAPNPNKRCHCRLTARNLSRNAAVPNGASWYNRPYIIPAT